MSIFPGVGDATDIFAPPAAPASRDIINPNDIGVKYFVIVTERGRRGGAFCAMFFAFIHPLVKYFFISIFPYTNWNIFIKALLLWREHRYFPIFFSIHDSICHPSPQIKLGLSDSYVKGIGQQFLLYQSGNLRLWISQRKTALTDSTL